ncbi:hypothetical protein CEXT_195121 [Caerostris extrusa]|uniref:Uncharacterized protein n=1 Tax=Caerostris extrusa TaxID=172846 RepID=A0AAV4M8C9_CAEEX|nr:hypothetical protein CEXT_195121 [Caerostris extrusa]
MRIKKFSRCDDVLHWFGAGLSTHTHTDKAFYTYKAVGQKIFKGGEREEKSWKIQIGSSEWGWTENANSTKWRSKKWWWHTFQKN